MEIGIISKIVQMIPSPIIQHTSGALNKTLRKQCGCILFLVNNVSPPIRLLIFASRDVSRWSEPASAGTCLSVCLQFCRRQRFDVGAESVTSHWGRHDALLSFALSKDKKNLNSRSIVNEASLRLFIASLFTDGHKKDTGLPQLDCAPCS